MVLEGSGEGREQLRGHPEPVIMKKSTDSFFVTHALHSSRTLLRIFLFFVAGAFCGEPIVLFSVSCIQKMEVRLFSLSFLRGRRSKVGRIEYF